MPCTTGNVCAEIVRLTDQWRGKCRHGGSACSRRNRNYKKFTKRKSETEPMPEVTNILAIQTKAIRKTISRVELREMLWQALARIEELEGELALAAINSKSKT